MAGLHIDLSDATEFEPLPDGWYVMAVQRADIKEKESEAQTEDALPKGTPFLAVGLATTEEHDNEDDVGSNRWVWNNFYFPGPDYQNTKKKNTMNGIFLGFLAALGFDKDELRNDGFDLENQVEELINRECEVHVGQREYNGKINNTVKSFRALTPTTSLDEL